MRLNPELRRYLWLEISVGRLLFMPLVLGLALLLVAVWTIDPTKPAGGQDFLATLAGTSSVGYALSVILWGARAAASAMVREVAERTWDQQRLSSTGAWSMTWGKLLGSTIFVWYGCLIMLAVMLVSMGLWEHHYDAVSKETGQSIAVTLLQLTVGSVALTILLEASVLLAAMTSVSRRESARQLDVTIAQIAVIVIAVFVFGMLDNLESGQQIPWFSHVFDAVWFAVVSAVLFAGWAVIGLWRLMRVELQMTNMPVMWPLFALFTGFWLAGLIMGADGATGVTWTVVIVTVTAMFLTYVPAVLERVNPVHLRRLIEAIGAGQIGSALRHAPLWIVSHVLVLVGVVISVVLLMLMEPGEAIDVADELAGVDLQSLAAGTMVAAYLFVTRDLMLLVFVWLRGRARRAFMTWLIWMVLLYGLAPLIVASVDAYTFLPAFAPAWDVPFVDLSIPPVLWPAAEVVLVGLLLRWRWRRYAASSLTSGG
ncbi:MAG: hypothetical protein HOK83_19115 [Rhodospirillaceae bacterium]|nr:hypothetical protein [Rhodospirillaceae bacterium]